MNAYLPLALELHIDQSLYPKGKTEFLEKAEKVSVLSVTVLTDCRQNHDMDLRKWICKTVNVVQYF